MDHSGEPSCTFYVGQRFDTFESLEIFLQKYTEQNQCKLWKRDSRTVEAIKRKVTRQINPRLYYYEVKYACTHGGLKFTTRGHGMRPSFCRTLKEDCPMHVRLRASDDGEALQVTSVNLTHNHDLSLETKPSQVPPPDPLALTTTTEKDGVMWITLNNPQKRNALSSAMLDALEVELTKCSEDTNLRCVVLSGNGPAFSAGHDLSEMTKANSKESIENLFEKCTRIMLSIQKLPVPVIAQVNGAAAAAGCQLAASCDIVIASENATFSTPGVRVGLFCSTPGVPVSRAVPQKAAAYMLLTGEPITAEEALRCGLVSKVVPGSKLHSETEKVVQSILTKSKATLILGKQFFYSQLKLDLETAYRQACNMMVENLELADCQEGITAFLTKRQPVWNHTFDKV